MAKRFHDLMEISVASSGEIYMVERKGAVKVIEPKSDKVTTIANLEVEVRTNKNYARECGLLGITLDPHF